MMKLSRHLFQSTYNSHSNYVPLEVDWLNSVSVRIRSIRILCGRDQFKLICIQCALFSLCRQALRNLVLPTQNATYVFISWCLSLSVCATQNMLILLNSLGFSIYVMKFVLKTTYIRMLRQNVIKLVRLKII